MASEKRKKIQEEKQKRLVKLKKVLAGGSKYAEKQRLKRLGSQP